MERLLKSLETLLFHPLLWGVVALLTLAIALSGKLSVNAASALIWVAYAAAIFGVWRADIFKSDHALRYLSLTATAILLATGAVLLQRWFHNKPVTETTTALRPSKKQRGGEAELTCNVIAIHLDSLYRFFQDPPVYFQRLDTAIRVELTSQVGRPLHLQDYAVSALVGTQWVPFKNADRADFEPYAFGVMGIGPDNRYLRRFDLSANLFDYVMRERPLGPYESKELWMFFISGLRRKNQADISQVRFVFRDGARHEFLCISPYSVEADKGTQIGVNSGDIRVMPFERIPPNIREEPPH